MAYETPKMALADMQGCYVGSTPARRWYDGDTLVYQGFSPASEQEFIQQTAAGGPAQLLKCYGKSVVWRQLVSFDTNTDGFKVGASASITAQSDGTYLINYGGGTSFSIVSKHNGEANHKYLIKAKIKLLTANSDKVVGVSQSNHLGNTSSSVGNNRILFDNTTTEWQTQSTIATANNSGFCYAAISQQNLSGTISDYYLGAWVFIDLTDYFGAGNEPTTIAEALKYFPADYYPYDPGSLQSNKTSLLRAYDGGNLRGSLALNLSTLTSGGVVVFPDGLRGVGTDRDAAYGSTGVVRLGKRAYQAGDESDTSVLTDGTNTIYPLATPLTYTLDTPLPTDLTCVQGDILQRVSDNNCPFVGEMRFGL